jgi:hypothetical protein
VKAKKSGFKTSNADLSMDIPDIMTNGVWQFGIKQFEYEILAELQD